MDIMTFKHKKLYFFVNFVWFLLGKILKCNQSSYWGYQYTIFQERLFFSCFSLTAPANNFPRIPLSEFHVWYEK
jgi:hypothetical protein